VYSHSCVPGLELASKLRRSLGRGKILPQEEIAAKMAAFDTDDDEALTQEELVLFLMKYRVGGKWFCEMVAKTLWNFCKAWYSRDVTWIKIEPLSWMVFNAMHDRQRPVRRYKITPEGAMGYVPLEPLEGSRILSEPKKSDASPATSEASPEAEPRPPRRAGPRRPPGGNPRSVGRPSGRSTRARPRPAVGRPGPRRNGPKK
jgi:hypothetical protein